MSGRDRKNPWVTLGVLGVLAGGAAVAAKSLNLSKTIDNMTAAATETPTPAAKRLEAAPTPTEGAMPYIPPTERINKQKKLPEDVILAEDLWKSYHTRIWQGKDTKMFLRPGIETQKIFQDLRDRKIYSLDIVLFDDKKELSAKQKQELDPDIVAEFERDSFPVGELYSSGNGHYAIFIEKSSLSLDRKHMLTSYPDPKDEFVVVYHTPAVILRHELAHYNTKDFSSSPEEEVGADMLSDLRQAEEKYKRGDDSGYFVVYEIKEGVVVS